MKKKIRIYEAPELVVEYDVSRCIHAAKCVQGLPQVFDPDQRPWIDPERAPAEDISEVIERCPTGALRFRWRDGGREEQPAPVNTVRVEKNGPLYVKGDLEIQMPEGKSMKETRAALCRCGHSKNKPFCDGSHKEMGFLAS